MNIRYHKYCLCLLSFLSTVSIASTSLDSDITRVIMLGTGTPFPDPLRSGPAVAIIVNKTPYIIDFGAGVIRQFARATPEYGGNIEGLELKNVTTAFLTHMHSDHTAGLPELIHTPWTFGRAVPLELYGPEGVVEMAAYITKAYDHDIKYRIYGLQRANNKGWRVNAHPVSEGTVYQDDNVTVEAFSVKHGSWPDAFGYRFTTPDKVIVISGDTSLDENIEKYSKGADLLIHEVFSEKGVSNLKAEHQAYHRTNHTSSQDLGAMAQRAGVKFLALYHVLLFGASESDILDEVARSYSGTLVLSNDGDIY